MISAVITLFFKYLFISVVLIFSKFILKYFYLKFQLRKVPGIEGFPFLGATWELARIPAQDQQEWFTEQGAKFKGNAFVLWLGMRPIINIQKPQHMEVLLPSIVNIKKSIIYNLITPWLGNGLLTSTGEKWLHHRRLLTPAFHFGVLEQFTEVMFEKAEILNNCLEAFVRDNPKEPLEIFDFASRYTLDVICETAMGVNMDAQRKTTNAYFKALHKFSILVMERFVQPWYAWDFLYSKTKDGRKFTKAIKVMHEFSTKVIREKLNKRQHTISRMCENNEDEFGRRKCRAFLDLLLEASETDAYPLSIDEIREQVDTFIFAGHDTTATAISWALFALGNTPEIQKKVQEELCDYFEDSTKRPVTIRDLSRLKYLDRVLKEVLRLYPSAPFIFRDLSEEVIFDGHTIPKNTCVMIGIFDLHRDPEVWENPLDFNPDRFLPENLKGRHPYSYIPFSAGPRNCIGQKFALLEVKIALAAVLRRWCVKSVKSPKEIKLQSDLVLRSFDSIKLYLKPLC